MKFTKGFTLIELLVVVAIISLLSSVVLSTTQAVRNRTKAVAFRQEVEQFKKGIEMYRLSNGRYPTPSSNDFDENVQYWQTGSDNTEGSNYTNGVSYLKTKISSYISKIPNFDRKDITNPSTATFLYIVNPTAATDKCKGDNTKPYVIFVRTWSNIYLEKAFSDLPEKDDNFAFKCLSL